MDKSGRINLRVTPAEKESWEQAAGGARNVSSWLRGLANDAVNAWPETGPMGDLGKQEFMPRTTAARTKGEMTCPRWMHHRPGVYCGSCQK